MKRHLIPSSVASKEPSTNLSHLQQIDSQLTLMLFLQSLIAIIAYIPFGAAVLYFNITGEWTKSSIRQAWEQVIANIIRLFSYLFAATGFYVSMISNRGFRGQFMHSFRIKRRIHPQEGTRTILKPLTTRVIQ
ncbi:unnamed protein product [Rotaria sp. Silwood2]|nr:unnamed protein product [Rotaria sp. Silwood2]CAF4611840.1 unnamed protein product [Rotaria sp. Silwood2]